MFFTLHDAAGQSLAGGPQNGSAPRRTPAVDCFRNHARKIWSELHDGPFDICYSDFAQASHLHLRLGRRSYWRRISSASQRTRINGDPGPFYGEDRVSSRGLRPAASGRFRYAEVEWDVTSPGDTCFGMACLKIPLSLPVGASQFSQGDGDLPAARTKLSFLFDGSLIAASLANPRFRAAAEICDSGPIPGVRPPLQTLALNPLEYEPSPHLILRAYQGTHCAYSGASGSTPLRCRTKQHPKFICANQVPEASR